jgi:hypothetical protein
MKNPPTLLSPASPIFAVFSGTGDRLPKSRRDLDLIPCPFVMQRKTTDGGLEINPLIVVAPQGLEEPSGENFLGFAGSLNQAIGEFL